MHRILPIFFTSQHQSDLHLQTFLYNIQVVSNPILGVS
ncbi:MAG: hypothetical protein TRG1_444 [Flavobacteriaceae bacterium FS1-H7996/R]|nr:MAG: hypothetical protein TRG1_444 [Flavobacteriaceae bacterium FS1-H7996/R]